MDEYIKSAEADLRRRLEACGRHVKNGVIIVDPYSVYLDADVEIGTGAVINPNTSLIGQTVIGKGCNIGPNTVLTDCRVGDGSSVLMSVATDAEIGAYSNIGPFAYLRPGSKIGDHVKVGDFVEIKNSVIGDGTKISHLTYVGDSDVGKGVNFGCGTVTVNYDGYKKYRIVVKDKAFIGCNTNLVAPVTVHENAYTAAGSTITADVPAEALAVARARQTNLEGWVPKKRAKEADNG